MLLGVAKPNPSSLFLPFFMLTVLALYPLSRNTTEKKEDIGVGIISCMTSSTFLSHPCY
jgi:hypothetical protein